MLVTGEEHGAVSAMPGHHVALLPGSQNDAELPQHRQRATHHERGKICLDKITMASLHLNIVLFIIIDFNGKCVLQPTFMFFCRMSDSHTLLCFM